MVEPKPEFLGRQFAAAFEDASVAAVYHLRPAYPPQTFAVLNDLIQDAPRRILDIGCGTGALARPLVELAESVDAVDASQVMIEQGRRMPNGEHPRLHWILGRIEETRLTPPYSLITAGESLHWMEWAVVMPRFGRLLSPSGVLAILELGSQPVPWQDELREIIKRYSINTGFQVYHLVDELSRRRLFTEQGRMQTGSETFEQTVEAYIEAFHARSAFSRQRMTPANAAAFDQAVGELVRRYEPHTVRQEIFAKIYWGRPHGVEG